ncbi:MAG: hypothetical protein ACRCTB_00865 [Vibrio sp.]
MIPGINTGGGSLMPDLSAGPSSAGSTTNNNNGFTGGTVNFGSNNGVPLWMLIGGGVLAAYFLMKSNKRGQR